MKISSRNSSAWVDVGKLCLLPAVAGADEAHLWARVSAGALWPSVLLWLYYFQTFTFIGKSVKMELLRRPQPEVPPRCFRCPVAARARRDIGRTAQKIPI